MNPNKPFNLDIDINTNVNSKIVQYCLENKIIQNHKIEIAECKALDKTNTKLYEQFPDFPTPNYLKQKLSNEEEKDKSREKHQNMLSFILSKEKQVYLFLIIIAQQKTPHSIRKMITLKLFLFQVKKKMIYPFWMK